jgi:hypothetical protein
MQESGPEVQRDGANTLATGAPFHLHSDSYLAIALPTIDSSWWILPRLSISRNESWSVASLGCIAVRLDDESRFHLSNSQVTLQRRAKISDALVVSVTPHL